MSTKKTPKITFDEDKKEEKTILDNGMSLDQLEMEHTYGFFVRDNCYYFMGKSNDSYWQGSNFVMEPLFHIESTINAKRLFKIKNTYNVERVIEFSQKDLNGIAAFRLRCESIGNFRFDAGEMGLNKIKALLYEQTKTCKEVTQLGWQKAGFFAWSNGIVEKNQFIPINEYGIVTHENENYYIPALSSFYKADETLFQFERRFVHNPGKINLYAYSELMLRVYGDNAIVGMCFYFASLFRDIIVSIFRFFPILNIFGPKGTGKSEMAVSLSKLFGDLPVGLNMTNSTLPALADHVSHTSNAICHVDEYKNSVEYEKIEFLKGLWDGTGRNRMNMEKDRKKEMTAVDTGIVLTGQEMTTADNALFSRVVFLSFTKTKFTSEEKTNFEELKNTEKQGLTQITNEMLLYRDCFLHDYVNEYNAAMDDVLQYINKLDTEDRILKNWTVLLAAFRLLKDKIKLPFTYEKAVEIFTSLMKRQNQEVFAGNEVSDFWNIYQDLFSQGIIEDDFDFKIKFQDVIKLKARKIEKPMRVLYINPIRIFNQYARTKREINEKKLPKDSLQYYIQNSEEFLGTVQYRFRKPIKNLQERESAKDYTTAPGTTKILYDRPYAWAFNYDKLKEKMNIDLMSYMEYANEEEEESTNIEMFDKKEEEEIFI
jgi:hypothetical protein